MTTAPVRELHYHRAYAEPNEDRAGSPIMYTASTPGVKRDGLDLRAAGWRTENYLRSPVVLFVHRHDIPPIGRAGAKVETGKLRMPVYFDQEDEFARQVESKVRRGFMPGCSVGWDFTDERGRPIEEWWRMNPDYIRDSAYYDLTELSVVPVPADPMALAERQRRGLRHYSRELARLLGEQDRPDSTARATDVRAAVRAELVRLGLPTDPAPAATGIDQNAARAVLAAFTLEGAP